MRPGFAALVTGLSCLTLAIAPSANASVSPEAAGFLSIVPGLGQVVQGEVVEGLAWFAAVAATMASGNSDIQRNGISLWQYNVYDAYKDAGARNSARVTLWENALGAFNPLNLIDWIGPPQLALNAYTIMSGSPDQVYRGPPNVILGTLWQTPNAVAEEGLYRGFFFPLLSGATHSKIVGAVFSSFLFNYGHLIYGYTLEQANQALVNDMVNGLLWCLQTDLNKYDLRHSIFTHMWIDAMIYYRWNGNLGSGGTRATGGGGGLAPGVAVGYRFFL